MDYRGLTMLVVAIGLIGWGLLAIGGAWFTGRTISEEGMNVLGVVGGALAGGLVGYWARGMPGGGDGT